MSIKRGIAETPGVLFFNPEQQIHINRVQESFILQEHTHDFIEISYVGEGIGSHYIGNTKLPVAQGELFFIPVGVSHVFRPNTLKKEQPLVVYNCIFTDEWYEQLLGIFPVDSNLIELLNKATEDKMWLQVRDRHGIFQQLFERLYMEFNARRSDYKLVIQSSVVELLVYMHRKLSEAHTEEYMDAHPSSMEGLHDLLAYIQNNCKDELPTVSEAAATLKVSDRQLHRIFMKHTGMTYMKFVQHARIQESCRLLRSTESKVFEIATQVGYSDMKFFNRLFKKITGVTPKQYRANHTFEIQGASRQ